MDVLSTGLPGRLKLERDVMPAPRRLAPAAPGLREVAGMECAEARGHLLDYPRGRLGPALHGAVHAHLTGCPACAREEAAEAVVTGLLERRLPQHPASLALKRRLAVQWPAAPLAPPSWWHWWPVLAPVLAVALLLVVAAPRAYEWTVGRAAPANMVGEAVNDHLRIVSGHHALEVEAGGIHQVTPWFAGKLDFAPVVTFG
jgi:anti-sigma factor RsiW